MPTKSKTIAIKISGTTIKNNTPVYVLNRNTGDRWTVYSLDDPAGMVALADLRRDNDAGESPTAWASGHVVEIQVIGQGYGAATVTLGNQQDQEVTISITSDSGPALSI